MWMCFERMLIYLSVLWTLFQENLPFFKCTFHTTATSQSLDTFTSATAQRFYSVQYQFTTTSSIRRRCLFCKHTSRKECYKPLTSGKIEQSYGRAHNARRFHMHPASAAVVAEISLRSPWKKIIFIIKKYIFIGSKYPKINNLSLTKKSLHPALFESLQCITPCNNHIRMWQEGQRWGRLVNSGNCYSLISRE